MLSLLVGGGHNRSVGVELVVDGVAVSVVSGTESDFMDPVLWDVSGYLGRTARLRVFDRSRNAHVLVDRVLLWD